MKKIFSAALLLCLAIACTKEPAPVVKKLKTAVDTVDSKVYDTIPVPIPVGDTSYPG